jgi:hypothetical protein
MAATGGRRGRSALDAALAGATVYDNTGIVSPAGHEPVLADPAVSAS